MSNSEDQLNICVRMLDECQIAYQAYLKVNRTFERATQLRKLNAALERHVKRIAPSFDGEIHSDLLLLRNHLESWRNQWDDHAKANAPALTDVFAFETRNRFPSEAVERLRSRASSNQLSERREP